MGKEMPGRTIRTFGDTMGAAEGADSEAYRAGSQYWSVRVRMCQVSKWQAANSETTMNDEHRDDCGYRGGI